MGWDIMFDITSSYIRFYLVIDQNTPEFRLPVNFIRVNSNVAAKEIISSWAALQHVAFRRK